MFINFDMMGEMYDVTITVYLGEQPIKKLSMTAPRPVLEAQFMNFVQQIASQKQPMRVVMERTEVIWDQFEQKHKELPLSVEFQNYES